MKTWYSVDSETAKVKEVSKYDDFQNNGKWFFETEKEAIDDYNFYKDIAIPELKEIKKKLELLQKELNFEINYAMYGDTFGIYEDYLYILIRKSHYSFRLKLD